MSLTQAEKNIRILSNCLKTFESVRARLLAPDAPVTLLSDLATIVEDCDLYLLPGYAMHTEQRQTLEALRQEAIDAHRKHQQRFPSYTGETENIRIQELLDEIERLRQFDLQNTSFRERQRLVEDIDLRCFEYQRDVNQIVHSFGPKLELFINAIKDIQNIRETILNVDRPYFAEMKSKRTHGTLQVAELRKLYLAHEPTEHYGSIARIGTADFFLTHLIGVFHTPTHEQEFSDDMRHYYPTPALVFTHLLCKVLCPTEKDVIYDFGSGLGRLPLLIRLLTPARAIGIEFEPRYHAVAQKVVNDLKLNNVKLLCEDAQHVDLSDGTIFYFYEPFRGSLLHVVVEKIKKIALLRTVRVISYGKTQCTDYLKDQDFLSLQSSSHDLFVFTTN